MHTGIVEVVEVEMTLHYDIFSLSGPQLRFMCLEALRRGSIYPQGTLPKTKLQHLQTFAILY